MWGRARTCACSMTLALTMLAFSGCKGDPRCHGEMSDQEIARLKDLAARGAAPCPGLRDPTVRLGAKGIELEGRVVTKPDELPRDGFPRLITALHAELARNRATWNRAHAGEKFEGIASIELGPDSDFVAGASAIVSAVQAGYPRARVKSGSVAFSADFGLVASSGAAGEPTRELHVERKSDGKHSAELREAKIIVTYLEQPTGVDGVTRWIDETCAVTRCDVVELYVPGEFQLSADLLRRLLALEAFEKHPPKIHFKSG